MLAREVNAPPWALTPRQQGAVVVRRDVGVRSRAFAAQPGVELAADEFVERAREIPRELVEGVAARVRAPGQARGGVADDVGAQDRRVAERGVPQFLQRRVEQHGAMPAGCTPERPAKAQHQLAASPAGEIREGAPLRVGQRQREALKGVDRQGEQHPVHMDRYAAVEVEVDARVRLNEAFETVAQPRWLREAGDEPRAQRRQALDDAERRRLVAVPICVWRRPTSQPARPIRSRSSPSSER